jgi:hypothetical protein
MQQSVELIIVSRLATALDWGGLRRTKIPLLHH